MESMSYENLRNDHLTRVQQLFLAHQEGLRAYALSIVRDFTTAQDIVQDAFLVVTSKAHDFDLESNFLAWASTIVRYRALDAMRRANQAILSEETLSVLAACEAGQLDCRIEWLMECLEKLTPNVQRLLQLRYEDSLKASEIAALIGWSKNAVSVATSRARAELRKCVEQFQLREELS
jgi:RNA polymerase sigma-70 factor, ECF subfamily